jgi:hypothetical protein
MSDVNGKNLDPQPEPGQIEGRKYCDTCKYANLIMNRDQPVTICRRYPPGVHGNFIGLQKSGQLTFQEFTNVNWPVVDKENWCGEYVEDPRAARSGGKSMSVISSDTSRAS